jgi:hypothetical protein
LTLETKEVESRDQVPVPKVSIESGITPIALDLSAAMKLAVFKIRTLRYVHVLFRMFSM